MEYCEKDLSIKKEIGKNTIELITRRVLVAIHTNALREHHIQWPLLGLKEK